MREKSDRPFLNIGLRFNQALGIQTGSKDFAETVHSHTMSSTSVLENDRRKRNAVTAEKLREFCGRFTSLHLHLPWSVRFIVVKAAFTFKRRPNTAAQEKFDGINVNH